MNIKIRGFTLVELVVTITILSIISGIAFISFVSYVKTSRDTLRFGDLGNIQQSLEGYFNTRGKYPESSSSIDITYKGAIAWYQGSFGDELLKKVKGINKKPVDPLTETDYSYSLLNTKKEYELGASLEGNSIVKNSIFNTTYASKETIPGTSLILGNYNGKILTVSSGGLDYILAIPTIMSGDANLNTIENIILNNKLAYSGLGVLASSYNNTSFITSKTFKYSPHNYVVFEGLIDDLVNDENKRILLMRKLQMAYSNTYISNHADYKDITSLKIDLLNPTTKLKQLSCFLVNNNLKRIDGCTEDLTTDIAILPPAREWDFYPADIRGLFVTGSLYTGNWSSNSCDSYNMNIVNLSPGADVIPTNLLANTMYKLSSGNYRTTGTINFDNCSSIIGDGNVYIKADNNINYIFNINNKDNVIIDAVNLEGVRLSSSPYVTYTSLGGINNSGNNSTFNNIKIYNNSGYGINSSGNNLSLNNVLLYHNDDGIILSGSDNVLSNITAYSNNRGLNITSSTNNSLSNLNLFNNFISLYLSNSSNNYFSNISTYSNSSHGIATNGSVSNNEFNNLYSYNNNINNNLSNLNRYYGSYKNYSNTTNNNLMVSGASHSIFLDGIEDTSPIFSDSQTTEPSISGWNHNTIGAHSNEIRTNFNLLLLSTFDGKEIYTYGIEVPFQSKLIKYNGSSLEYFGLDGEEYYTTKYIGEW